MDTLTILPSRSAYADGQSIERYISHGHGAYLYDRDGRRYFDAAGGSGSVILGHGDGWIAEVLASQARRLTLFPGRLAASEVVERYVRQLTDFAPDRIDRAVLYSSGSDAVEAAIKLVLQYHSMLGATRRHKILGRAASYHGNTLAGLAAGGFIKRRKPYETTLPQLRKPAPCQCGAWDRPKQSSACQLECIASLEAAIEHEGPETVAAFIAEPVVGAALSAAVPGPMYFQRVREVCDRYGILFIADEVMTGFGRTGERFAMQHWGVTPDLIICGKAISGGYFPLSALLVHRDLADMFRDRKQMFQNGHTHACSPLASAVGAHVLDRIESEGLVANARLQGTALLDALQDRIRHPLVKEVRGLGLMIGIEFCGPDGGAAAPGTAERFQRLAMEREVLVYPSSGSAESEAGEHLMLLPPLNIDDRHVDFLVDRLAAAIDDLGEMTGRGMATC